MRYKKTTKSLYLLAAPVVVVGGGSVGERGVTKKDCDKVYITNIELKPNLLNPRNITCGREHTVSCLLN